MKQLPKIIASVLIQNQDKFLLVKEILESSKEYWIIPGGKVNFGEKIIDAAQREIKEELGIAVEIIKFIDFKEAIHTNHNYHTVIFFFLAKPLNDEIKVGDNILDAKYFSVEEIKNLNLVDSAQWAFKRLGLIE